MIETPFFFKNNTYNLFGVLHEPENRTKKLGFVFVHPFAEEKLWSHRVYVSFARELTDRGYPVLRFDVMGHGDSDGDFEDSSVETQLSDVQCALRTLKEKAPQISEFGLLGLRFGATLAAIIAEKSSDVRKLILWDPIIDCSMYIQEMLRINLTTQTAVYKEIRHTRDDLVRMMKEGKTANVDGYEMSFAMFEQASGVNLLKDKKNFTGDCLIMQISKKQEAYKKNMESLKAGYASAEIRLAIEEPFWKEIRTFYAKARNLSEGTKSWLEAK